MRRSAGPWCRDVPRRRRAAARTDRRPSRTPGRSRLGEHVAFLGVQQVDEAQHDGEQPPVYLVRVVG